MTTRLVRALLLLFPLAGPTAAQEPVRGDSSAHDSLRVHQLPAVIVTGVAVPTLEDRVGFSASVLTRAEMAADPLPYAAQALARLPGMAIDEGAGPGGPAVIRLRG